MSEQIRRVFTQYEVPAYFKPMNTLHQVFVRPKDKILNERVVGPVYHITFHVVPVVPHNKVKQNNR